jgi:hypothetical protein
MKITGHKNYRTGERHVHLNRRSVEKEDIARTLREFENKANYKAENIADSQRKTV